MMRPCPRRDYQKEFDTMADLNKAEMLFGGKYLDLAARNGGTFHRRLGSNIHPHQFSAGDLPTPVAVND
jgi:hypothetical protein